jgi:hypothetical protein
MFISIIGSARAPVLLLSEAACMLMVVLLEVCEGIATQA